jgi:hypothetical protein
MIKEILLSVLVLTSFASVPGRVEAKSIAHPRIIEGSVAKENIDRVNSDIRWNTSLYQALEQARRENKMVLWVQMIGQMSGST